MDHPHADMGNPGQQAAALETADCLAQRSPADAQPAGEFGLTEGDARRQIPVQDRAFQHVVGDVGQGSHINPLDTHRDRPHSRPLVSSDHDLTRPTGWQCVLVDC
jgi:hypothetical protein